jgi:hypothetical protein
MITRGRFAGTTTVALVAMAVTAALASVVSITGLSSPTPMT